MAFAVTGIGVFGGTAAAEKCKGSAVPAGSTIVYIAHATTNGQTFIGMTDDAGNSYTAVGTTQSPANTASHGTVGVWICQNCLALTAAQNVYATCNSTNSNGGAAVAFYITGAGAIDLAATFETTGTGTTPTGLISGTPVSPNSLFLGMLGGWNIGSPSLNSSWADDATFTQINKETYTSAFAAASFMVASDGLAHGWAPTFVSSQWAGWIVVVSPPTVTVTADIAGSMGIVSTVNADRSALAEPASSPQRDALSGLDAGTAMSRDFVGLVDPAVGLAAHNVPPEEIACSMLAEHNAGMEALPGSSRLVTVDLDGIVGLVIDRVYAAEFGLGCGHDETVPMSGIVLLAGSTLGQVEGYNGLSIDLGGLIDAGQLMFGDSMFGLIADGGAGFDNLFAADIQSGLQKRIRHSALEFVTQLAADGMMAAGADGGLEADVNTLPEMANAAALDIVLPSDCLASPSADALAAVSWHTSLLRDMGAVFEAGAAAYSDIAIPADTLALLIARQNQPLEWSDTVLSLPFASHESPVDWLSNVGADVPCAQDALASSILDGAVSMESSTGLRTRMLPALDAARVINNTRRGTADFLAGAVADALAATDVLASIARRIGQPIEYSVLALARMHGTASIDGTTRLQAKAAVEQLSSALSDMLVPSDRNVLVLAAACGRIERLTLLARDLDVPVAPCVLLARDLTAAVVWDANVSLLLSHAHSPLDWAGAIGARQSLLPDWAATPFMYDPRFYVQAERRPRSGIRDDP